MVLSGVGTILLVFPFTMLLPFMVGILFKEDISFLFKCFILPALATFSVGFLFTNIFGRADRPTDEMRPSESLLVVALVWLVTSLSGAMPYVLSGAIPNIIGAYFEAMSGFTTTGASVIIDVDGVQKSILFWRALTQWLGGMGIVVLVVAFFSRFLGGYKASLLMLKGEVPGHSAERLVHRIRDTAKFLWLIYLIFTIIGTMVLTILGLSVYDAICHTFAALSTGGFSTHTASVAYYEKMPTYELVQIFIVVLMLAGSVNFVLHYNFLIKRRFRSYVKNPEFRVYMGIIIFFICLITLNLVLVRTYGPGRSLLGAIFTVTSIISTSGFGTEDFAIWPMFSQFLILVLMIIGGMTSSTTGGIKVARFMVASKAIRRSLLRIGHPRASSPVFIGGIVIPEKIVKMIGMFVFGYLSIFLLGSFLMVLTGLDTLSAISAAAASLGNIGPGLGSVGPYLNYSSVNPAGKIILTILMWLGRLELVTGLVIFFPSTYRK